MTGVVVDASCSVLTALAAHYTHRDPVGHQDNGGAELGNRVRANRHHGIGPGAAHDEAHAAGIAEPPPEIPLESMWPAQPESAQQEPPAADPARVAPDPAETSSAPDRSAGTPAASGPADEAWQLPQWQYATKRARLNQRRQRK